MRRVLIPVLLMTVKWDGLTSVVDGNCTDWPIRARSTFTVYRHDRCRWSEAHWTALCSLLSALCPRYNKVFSVIRPLAGQHEDSRPDPIIARSFRFAVNNAHCRLVTTSLSGFISCQPICLAQSPVRNLCTKRHIEIRYFQSFLLTDTQRMARQNTRR